MERLVFLQRVIDYIEDHIKEELSAEELAGMVGYSPYHFSRIFYKQTGYTLMDYVVKRKLQFALYELVNGKKIIEIAMDYGFETHAGFTKAFKKCFGSPPSLYKEHGPTSLPQKLDLMSLHEKNTGGIVLQPQIVLRDAFNVAGKIFSIENFPADRNVPAFWDQEGLTDGSIERYLYKELSPKKHGEYCINLSRSLDENMCRYLFAVNYDDEKVLPDGITATQIPEAVYAIFRTPLVEVSQFATAIKGTWRYILEEWFPHSSYEVDEEGFDFEFYDEHCHYWDFKRVYMEIHIPIKEKSREITLEIF
ncbi:AraC family transcriptional regulator [Mesobacillus subterraneus]|uniref:AraC family transcriptional regulator n=1 Tax=Mesobacillus subterraneus TaxID=285983 RepID=A0A427TVF1_9BACI|nr:AraC family transcriptional regulator [Mesobacillus subterraneus]RSD28467.1 AraC family transcriptional regulator [Mesobacillus subterraneus]